MYSNQTCLACLRRKPEYVLSCGHSVCDICVGIFGRPVLGSEDTYELESCPLCFSGRLTVALKAPSAGVRILSVDDGENRGVVPLEFFGILQNAVGPDCSIRGLLDFAFGTRSDEPSLGPRNDRLLMALTGGLIVLGLFYRQWGVTQCIDV